MMQFYESHLDHIRKFVAKYSGHRLIEVPTDDESAGDILSSAFHLNVTCWGQSKKAGDAETKRKAGKTKRNHPPILVMGMPKSGTSSINDFFQCNGFRASHQYCGVVGFCGLAIRDNLQQQLPPLHGFDKQFDVFTQLDTNNPPSKCYYPQIQALEEIHQHYPNTTLILNTRNSSAWLNSVSKWHGLRGRLTQCDLPGFPEGVGKKDEEMLEFYQNHLERIREFAKRYPSHHLIEVSINDEKAGDILASAFHLNATCWGQSNKAGDSKTNMKPRKTINGQPPILAVGLPKPGMSSIHDFFECNGLQSSKYAPQIRGNVQNQLPPLYGFDESFDVIPQLATTIPPSNCYYPQIQALEEIHQHYPNMTLILNKQTASAWLRSVNEGVNMRQRLIKCDLPEFPEGVGATDDEMLQFYESHLDRIRKFVAKYSSHRLIEVPTDDESAGDILSSAFHLNVTCWGQSKKARDEKTNQNRR
jgi:hypothetical protein